MLSVFLLVAALVYAQAVHANVEFGVEGTHVVKSRQYNHGLRIASDGYYSETYILTASDGYNLEMIRIPYKRFQFWGNPFAKRKPVVLLMHGLQSSSLSYITLGARRSLAYNLADAGFDVWMGNARGVFNSRSHVTLNPDNREDAKEFFDYTFEDVATKDLPAMVDYVLKETRQEKLHYVGHSQGGTAFYVLNSLMPEYNEKFITADILAGVGYQDYFPSEMINNLANSTDLIYNIAIRTGLHEIALGFNNQIKEKNLNLDDSAMLEVFGSTLEVIGKLRHLEVVSGASVKQYAHYGQNIRDKAFRRWNYGSVGNILNYGRFEPPTYDISRITVDLTMHYAMSDDLLSEQDVLNMAKVIPNAKARRVARDSFGHMDFVISNDSKELVTDYIVQELSKLYE